MPGVQSAQIAVRNHRRGVGLLWIGIKLVLLRIVLKKTW